MFCKVCKLFFSMPKRIQDSMIFSAALCGILSSICTICDFSLREFGIGNVLSRMGIFFAVYVLVCVVTYLILGALYKKSINLQIRGMKVSICYGDIFSCKELKVIGCDTHFDSRIDDVVIAKKSLHGQLFLQHGVVKDIKKAIRKEAERLNLAKDDSDLYDFPLGTIIRYDNNSDNNGYLMLALTKLNKDFKACSDIVTFESTLMKMWHEIDRVYASTDVAIPLLGTGITRFSDIQKDRETLLRCMLCTLNNSGITLNANIKILIYGTSKDIALYEYKNIFATVKGK